jgi:hypothetical protein
MLWGAGVLSGYGGIYLSVSVAISERPRIFYILGLALFVLSLALGWLSTSLLSNLARSFATTSSSAHIETCAI